MKLIKTLKKAAVYLPILVTLAVAGYLLFTYPKGILDDAYIYGRYATNLVHYGQLIWNIGEAPVEGYTGILLPLIYSVFFLLNINFQTAVVIVGFSCFCGTAIVFWGFIKKFTDNLFFLNSFPYFVILAPFFYNHIISGLETMLFLFLLTASFSLFFYQVIIGNTLKRSLVATLLLLSLTRPEGIVFGVSILFITEIILFIKFKKLQKNFQGTILAFFAAPLLVYFLWKLVYYGYLLPNTYYAKSLSFVMDLSVNSYTDFIVNNPYVISVIVAIGIGIIINLVNKDFEPKENQEFPKFRRYFLPFVLAVLIPTGVLFVQYSRTTLIMNIDYRFFLPTYLTLLMAVSLFVILSFEKSNIGKYTRTIFSCLIFTVSLYQIITYFPGNYHSFKSEANEIERVLHAEHIIIGKKLAEVVPKTEKIAVIYDAGAIPFYSGLNTIDMGELNDVFLAHHDLTDAEKADYLLNNHPAAIIVTNYNINKEKKFLSVLINDPRFSQYELAGIYTDPANLSNDGYTENVFIQNNLLKLYIGENQD